MAGLRSLLLGSLFAPAPLSEAQKAASLAVGNNSRQPRGYWLGDPVTSGTFIETGPGSPWGTWRGNGGFDYRRAVGDGTGSSIVVAVLNAITSAMPEPPPMAYQQDAKGEEEKAPGHPAVALLKRPNPHMSWEEAGRYVAGAQHTAGAAYFWKARSAASRLVELWPIPPSVITPAWPDEEATTRTWITHFRYQPDSRRAATSLPVEDVVYLPYCMSATDLRTPQSPLLPVLREIFTDEEASAFLAALVNNYAVPTVILTPEPGGSGNAPNAEQVTRTKNELVQRFGGDRRGEPMVTGGPWKVTQVGYSPADLQLDRLRLLPESRVCAALNCPAIVANLLVGMESATYNNTAGLREHFTEAKMIPYWRLLAAQLSRALLPEFGADQATLRLGFDLDDVRALQEDQDAKYKRTAEALRAGGITLNDYRRELGYPEYPAEQGDVLYVPINVAPTKPEDLLAEPEPVAPEVPALPDGANEGDERVPMPMLPPPAASGMRASIRALPARKAVHPMGTGITRLRSRLLVPLETELRRFLTAQADRIAGRLVQNTKALTSILPLAEELVPDDLERKRLSDVLEAYYLRTLQGVHSLTEDTLGLAFDLDDPITRRYLAEAGANIGGITETTREAVRAALAEGQAAGEGIPQLAKRLRDLPAFNRARATLVARTELGEASNRAAMTSYGASGVVVGVEILDQESCAPEGGPCIGWNGRKLTLAQAAAVPLLFHPQCTAARAPIVDAAELEGAA